MDFINSLNGQWVNVSTAAQPAHADGPSSEPAANVADLFEALPLEAPALFAVSWAGEESSAGWFDIGREFTELWHHQEQIRMAVGAPSLADPRSLQAVIAIAMRGLPHAFRNVGADEGDAITIDATGPAGGQWTIQYSSGGWKIHAGAPSAPTARVWMLDDNAWRLLFNALKGDMARAAVQIEGRAELVEPLLVARSVIV